MVSFSPFTSTVGGGVASRTGPPIRSGTCRCNLLGLAPNALLLAGGSGKLNAEVLTSESSTTGVAGMTLSRKLIVGPVFVFGLAGKVENGPSETDRLLGGLPRNLPAEKLLLLGHADDTAGPWRLLDLEDDGVMAD